MVTVIEYNIRTQKDNEQKVYISFELEGDIELVQSPAKARQYTALWRL